MRYLFGKSFTRVFYAGNDGTAVQLPVQMPTIYIFDEQPTRQEAEAGTGAIQTITSWTQSSTTPFGNSYTVAAINDPDTTSSTVERVYWEAIRYTLEASEQVQTTIRSFEVRRAFGPDALPGTTVAQLKEVYPSISAYFSDAQLADFLETATTELLNYFHKKKLIWEHVDSLERLQLPLAYRTILVGLRTLVITQGDRHSERYRLFKEAHDEFMEGLALPYDTNQDGVSDAYVEQQATEYRVLR